MTRFYCPFFRSKPTSSAPLEKLAKTQEDFLRFLDNNFGGYEINNEGINFVADGNGQKYADLAKKVQDAVAEFGGAATQTNPSLDALKNKPQ